MIDLEIQALSERKDGLLIEVGRAVVASGFTLQRQRLTQDVNGVLMTMVVRGPERKQRGLEAALESHERIISFDVSPFEEGVSRPHFAAAVKIDRPPAPLPPVAEVVAVAAPAHMPPPSPQPKNEERVVAEIDPVIVAGEDAQPFTASELSSDAEYLIAPTRVSAPAVALPVSEPFVEVIPLEADAQAVEKILPALLQEYPQIFSSLLSLQGGVAAGARESSLSLAGQLTGAHVRHRDFAGRNGLTLTEAIESIAIPALSELVQIQQKGEQLHIQDSPLCAEEGHSGCVFFSGYLEGLLGPTIKGESLSIFAVCCRSYGADECVLALSD